MGALLFIFVLAPTPLPLLMEPTETAAAPFAPLTIMRGTVGPNATLGSLLSPVLRPPGVHALVEAARPVYDLTRLSVGRPFGLALAPGGLLGAFTYDIDELRTLRVVRRGAALEAKLLTRSFEIRTVTVVGTIESSLFASVTETGEKDQLALDLAEIFAWDLDFHTEIQKGDRFRVVVEKLFLDGHFSRYGWILAAEFDRGDRVLQAVRFEGSRGVGYYAPDGTPLRKAFLRSPLKFTRISSRFTGRRFHPILKRVTAHLGVDYAAPAGTPVLAAAEGIVTFAGWLEGFGYTVRIRHANGYETLYGHLSRVAVQPGQRIGQGAPVGAVGSTGLSTGPHLDYRMIRNGSFVNPFTVTSPPAQPLPSAELQAFSSIRDARLASLSSAHVRLTAVALGAQR